MGTTRSLTVFRSRRKKADFLPLHGSCYRQYREKEKGNEKRANVFILTISVMIVAINWCSFVRHHYLERENNNEPRDGSYISVSKLKV